MQTNKFLLDLGLCKRAGKAVFGFDDVERHIGLNAVRTVFIASDASENTVRRMKRICGEYDVKTVDVEFTSSEIGIATGRKPTAIFAVTDKGFDGLLSGSL